MKFANILYITILLTCIACSNSHPDIGERPSSQPVDDRELTDATPRISGGLLNLNYDDGGILFSRTTDGRITAVRVDDGTSFDFDPSIPSLSINGVQAAISHCSLLKSENDKQWYRLTLTDGSSTIIVN